MRYATAAFFVLLANAISVNAAFKPTDIPQFTLRARVMSINGNAPKPKQRYVFRIAQVKKSLVTHGSDWSDELHFDISAAIKYTKGYPHLYLRRFPVVLRLGVSPAANGIVIEAELRWAKAKTAEDAAAEDAAGDDEELDDEQPLPKADAVLRDELFGPSLGFLLWKEGSTSKAATMAVYNERYWKGLEGVNVSLEERPQKLPIVNRFIGGDHSKRNWREGIQNLSKAGFNVISDLHSANQRQVLHTTGLTKVAHAVYNPPGYAWDWDPKITPEFIDEWAEKQFAPFAKGGFKPTDIALINMSDEPGWYYPTVLENIIKHKTVLKRFQDYVKDQGLKPVDVGKDSWADVQPIGRSKAVDLPSKRLFYWSVRFVSWDSSRHFANSTRALEKVFYPGVPIATNWNNFSGRLVFPGPFGHNPKKDSPDSMMGCHDWLEFGRMRGCTMLWTEDWFGDGRAWQWSFYASKLNTAARKGNVVWGGYIVGRTCGQRKDGYLQRAMTIVGHGGKAISNYIFGPEYNFPGNCYSDKLKILPSVAEAHVMIGAAEKYLWPGKREVSPVAILHPRSSQMWDIMKEKSPMSIIDITNVRPEAKTVDYMAEVYGLYLALQHANIPVDWAEDNDLSVEGLKDVKVLYVVEPNVATEYQKGLFEWVKAGGTLVTVNGAMSADRYNEPSELYGTFSGIDNSGHVRQRVALIQRLKRSGTSKSRHGEFRAVGNRSKKPIHGHKVLATFTDGSTAITHRQVARGQLIHFTWMPGMSYFASQKGVADGLPIGFSDPLRKWIAEPVAVAVAGIQPPVVIDRPMIEGPLLVSDVGAAVTLINWTGKPQSKVKVSIRTPFKVKRIRGVRAGKLTHEEKDGVVSCTLDLGAADVLMLDR